MMTPIHNEHTNMNLGAPRNWDEKQGTCVTLPVHHNEDGFYSWWTLTWGERLKVLFGKPIRLGVLADSHPPVSLKVTKD